MAYSYDGYLRFNTEIDKSGFDKGVSIMQSAAALGAKAITAGFAAVSGAVTAVSTYAIAAGSSFEAAMSTVQATSQASAADMELLSAKAKEMGATTKFSATESAQALNFMAQAGWNTKSMLEGLPGVMNLAAASGEDLASVSDIVTDSLTAFGLQASDSARFADVLAQAAAASNTDVAKMGSTFKYVAPVAGALKYSIEDTAVAIGLLANAGIKSEMAGTQLRAWISRMVSPTKESAAAMDALKISVKNSDGTMKDFITILSDLRKGMAGYTDDQKASYAAMLGGQEAMSGLLAIANASEADFQNLTKAINNSGGAAEEMAKTVNDNLKGDLTILGSTAESVGIKIYEKFQKPMRNAAQDATKSLGDVLSSLNSGQLDKSVDKIAYSAGRLLSATADLAAKGLPKLLDGFAFIIDNAPKAAAGITSMATAFGVYKSAVAVDTVVKGWKAATIAVDAYRASSAISITTLTAQQLAVGGLTGKIGLNTVATGLATKAQSAFNMAVLANPATWIVGGIAALTVGLLALDQQQSETEKSTIKLNEALEEQRQARVEAEKARENSMRGAVAEIDHAESLIDKFDGIIDSNGKIKEGYEGRAKALRDQINSILPDAITLSEKEGDMYLKVADDLGVLIEKKKISALIDANQADYAQALRDQQENVNNLRDANEKLAESKANLQKIEEDYAKAREEGKIIVDIGPNNLERQRKDAEEAVSVMQAKVGEAQTALQESTKLITDQDNLIAASHSNNIDEMKTALDNMLKTQVDYTNKSKAEMDTQLSNVIGNYQSLYRITMESGGQINDAQFNLLVQSRQNMLTEIDSYLATGEKIPKNLAAGIASTAQEYKNSIDNLIKGGKITVEQANQLMNLAGVDWGKEIAKGNESAEVKTSISSAAENNAFLAMTTTRSAWKIENGESGEGAKLGGYYTAGVASGIASQESIAKVQNSATVMAQAADRATRRALDINSPSKVGMVTGGFYGEGIAIGISSSKDKILESITALSEDSIKSAKEKAGSYKELGSLYIEKMEDGINKRKDNLLDKVKTLVEEQADTFKEENKKKENLEKYTKAANSLMETYKLALEAGANDALKLLKTKVKDITEEAQTQYDEIIKNQANLESKLSDYGKLYSKDAEGNISIEKIEKQTEALRKFGEYLDKLKENGASAELLNEIINAGVEEGTIVAEKLVNNTSLFEKVNEAWTLKQEEVKTIATKFYQDELTTLDTEFTQKLDTALATIPEQCTNVGIDAIKGVIEGIKSMKDEAVSTAKDVADAIFKELKRATETASPSKRAAREVGKPLTQGIIKGMNDAYDPQELQAYTNKMMLDIGGSQAKAAAQSVSYMNTSSVSNNSTYNGGDFILKIEKVINEGRGSVSSLLQEAEFYRRQQVSAVGGV